MQNEIAKLAAELAIKMAQMRAAKTLNTVEYGGPELKRTFAYKPHGQL